MQTEDVHTIYKFCKNRARDPPLWGKYIGKIPIFSVFGAVNPYPWTDQGEIWHGATVRSSMPNFTLIGATCRPCGAKNRKIGPWVKTIPAELPAADPAGKYSVHGRSPCLRHRCILLYRYRQNINQFTLIYNNTNDNSLYLVVHFLVLHVHTPSCFHIIPS